MVDTWALRDGGSGSGMLSSVWESDEWIQGADGRRVDGGRMRGMTVERKRESERMMPDEAGNCNAKEGLRARASQRDTPALTPRNPAS